MFHRDIYKCDSCGHEIEAERDCNVNGKCSSCHIGRYRFYAETYDQEFVDQEKYERQQDEEYENRHRYDRY